MTRSTRHRCFPAILLLVTLGGCDRTDPGAPSVPKPLAPAAQSSTTSTVAPKPPEPAKEIVTRLTVAPIDPTSASEIVRSAAAAISQRLEACWKAPEAPDALSVSLQLNLNPDGSVLSVTVLEKSIFAANAAYRAAAREATSAFFKCSPFVLPISGYAGWKSLALRITPHH